MEEFKIKTRVVGVDIAVDYTTCAIIDIRGTIIAKEAFATSDYPNLSNYVSVLYEKIVRLAENNGGIENIRSVGISAPSSNFKTGCIENASNLPWKGNVPLAAMLRDRLGLAVAVANDAHVTALGEQAFGSAHGMKNFIVMTFSGGGVGSCIVIKGSPHLGTDGFAGEVGHTCVVENGRQCGCGKKGCLETYASATGIVRTMTELLCNSRKPSPLRDIPNSKLTSYDVFKAYQNGDELAKECFDYTGKILGMKLADVVCHTSPSTIFLFGGPAKAGDIMCPVCKKQYTK